MTILRTIARHGMTKGAAFFYAVAVGAAANFVIDYLHHRDDVVPVVAHETTPAPATTSEREHIATAPIARPEPRPSEPRSGEPRAAEPRAPEHSTTASLPPVPEVKPIAPAALPQVPILPAPSASASLPPSSDLPTPALKPAAVPGLSALPAAPAERPSFAVPPAAPAAASTVPPADKPADKPVEAMSIPTPPSPSIGNPVSLLPPPDQPPEPPAPKKPGSGTGGLY